MSEAGGYASASGMNENPTETMWRWGQATLLNTWMIVAIIDEPLVGQCHHCCCLIPPWYIRQVAKILRSSSRPTLIESVRRKEVSDELVLGSPWYDLDRISILTQAGPEHGWFRKKLGACAQNYIQQLHTSTFFWKEPRILCRPMGYWDYLSMAQDWLASL